jgi:nitroreductase
MTAVAPVRQQQPLEAAVAYAVLAPSTHNTQPWRFTVADDVLLLYADLSRAMPAVDPDQRELIMSCGAALFNLRTVLQSWGYAVRTELMPDDRQPDLLARVTIVPGRPGTEEQRALVVAMGWRHTHRAAFADKPLPAGLAEALQVSADREGAWLAVLDGAVAAQTADLVGRASRARLRSADYRRDRAAWLRPNWTDRPDGVPGYAFGFNWLQAALGRFAVSQVARREEELARRAPALVVVGTEGDTRRAWLAAGQALQRVLLTAALHGVQASFLNAPVQIKEMRRQLLAFTPRRGAPQVVLRLGVSGPARATPRRLPTEVLRDIP